MIDGIIVVNKEIGYTSRDIVNIVCKKFNTKKVGHTGTLDPLASGVLVLCMGRALKMSELLTSNNKEYIAGITLGISTDTIDMDGKITDECDVDYTDGEIITAVNSFLGTYLQEVPKYSAIKINGRKLYDYARSNVEVNLPRREVTINKIMLCSDIKRCEGKISFNIKCNVSKGTYIRSLVRDIGEKLGCPAVMNSLVRTKQGCFLIEDANTLEDILNDRGKVIDILDAFKEIKRIIVQDEMAFKIKNGVAIRGLFKEEMAFILDNEKKLLALYKNNEGICRAYKMFL